MGGSIAPVALAKMASVDIMTEQPLKETIAFIGNRVDQLEDLTAQINASK